MDSVSKRDNFCNLSKLFLQEWFAIHGDVKTSVVIAKKEGVIEVRCVAISNCEDIEKLHESVLCTVVDLIRRRNPLEIFVGYEALYLMEEKAVRILVGTFYSDDEESVWIVQIHGMTLGEWQEVSDNQNRCGFEGLWKQAKAYQYN